MKVYVVTYGCYSDQYVSAVFSTQQDAEEHAKLDEDGSVDEFELDGERGAQAYSVHRVVLDAHGNNTAGSYGPVPTVRVCPDASGHSGSGRCIGFWGESPDPDKALKLAAEARQAWLRENSTGS